jgi:fido (protein-threonine AMPylation protein)
VALITGEMYAAIDDPYCYPGTTVLKNVPGIQDQAALDEFEIAIVAQRSDAPLPRGRFSLHHYCAVHRHLFQDVYHWAGRFRTVRISKGGSTFLLSREHSRSNPQAVPGAAATTRPTRPHPARVPQERGSLSW